MGSIVRTAQASIDADAAQRSAERDRLKSERTRLFSFTASADPEKLADAIASAQRRMRGIDAELAQLLDASVVSEPSKAAEVEIEARKALIKGRRDRALKDRETYLPEVAKGSAGAAQRSQTNMALAALILGLISAIGSGFELPAKSDAELHEQRLAGRRVKRGFLTLVAKWLDGRAKPVAQPKPEDTVTPFPSRTRLGRGFAG
ncbi:MAG: hypothetical protein EBX39_04835 [Actinobacteria bacterium]|nr:hypothetical protein [Actinomycetota bacterium]